MTATDTARLALQALLRYPLRTGMLLLAIAIGVAAVVTLTAVGEGARRYVSGQFASLGTNLLIVLPGRSETAGAGLQGMLIGETAREITLDDVIALTRSARITTVAPVVVGAGTASWRARERDITVLGTTASMARIQDWRLASGQFLPASDFDVAAAVCVLGSQVTTELFGRETAAVGQWVRVGDARCRVVGTLAEAGLSGGFTVDETVIMPVANVQQLFNTSSVFRILVEASSRESIQSARRDVIEIIKARHAGEEDVTVVTQDAVVSTFDSIFGMITAGLAAIAAISLVVAGVLIMNVMLVAVSQRTNEIGLLKALGARNRQIVVLFLAEAGCLSLAGAVLGLSMGLTGVYLMRVAFPVLDFAAPAWAALAAVGVAISSGLLFGILPARRAARLDPVQALAQR
jgi:putative ABC transport system permease protein